MQIGCQRYSCMKAVEVCYWTCKFRKNCKDWRDALVKEPGMEAISDTLRAASQKSGRVFDPQTMILIKGKRAAAQVVEPSSLPF